jgi:hypothetical protein
LSMAHIPSGGGRDSPRAAAEVREALSRVGDLALLALRDAASSTSAVTESEARGT